jgi:hypothetical protein
LYALKCEKSQRITYLSSHKAFLGIGQPVLGGQQTLKSICRTFAAPARNPLAPSFRFDR